MSEDRRISRRAFVAAAAVSPMLSSVAKLRTHGKQTELKAPPAVIGGFTLFRGWLVLAPDKRKLETSGPATDE
jgi:hypothetical protein